MKNTLRRIRVFFVRSSRHLSEMLYVPSQTGSHDLGEQYMGDIASTYVEHKNYPESARAPFRRIVLTKRH